MILCVKLGYILPGKRTIPDQIAENKMPYYKALEAADLAWEKNEINLTAMKDLLASMLATQLLAVHGDSQSGDE
jgi:hypothetical protein